MLKPANILRTHLFHSNLAVLLFARSGDVTYAIGTSVTGSSGFVVMYRSVDTTSQEAYKNNRLRFTYPKL